MAALAGGAVAAVAFLTRLPVGRFANVGHGTVARAAPFYPLVGAGLWAIAGVLGWGLSAVQPPLLAAVFVVAFLTLATGALHLDALADTADALGGWSREQRLRIMRDHAIGSYGGAALVLICLVEVAALVSIVEHGPAIALLAAVGASSRSVACPLAATLPYARAGEQNVAAEISAPGAVAAVLLGAAAATVAGIDGFVVLGTSLAVGAGLGLFYLLWLGGVTGDTLGAAIQLAEAAGLVAVVVLL